MWTDAINPESWQAPLYYAIAGLWLKLGHWCGLTGGHLLYWLRFLNALFVAALVWLSFVAAREFFPKQAWLRMCVPTLVAFIPQDMFYGIEQRHSVATLFWGGLYLPSPLVARGNAESSPRALPGIGGFRDVI